MTSTNYPNQKIRLWEPLFVLFFAVAAIIYAINAFNSQDLLWFLSKSVNATPDRIVVWVDGEQTVIQPGHDDYITLSTAVNQSVSDFSNTNLINIGFGEDTLDYYDSDGVLVELYYNNPVNFHAPFRTGEPTQLLVPVDGRHAGKDYFFRGDQGEWWFGAMRMADSKPLLTTLSDLGYQ